MRSSSLQQSKDTTTLAAPQEQAAPGQPMQEAMEEDTAHSPVSEHQVMVSFAWPNLLSVYIVAEFQLEVVVLDQPAKPFVVLYIFRYSCACQLLSMHHGSTCLYPTD